MNLVKTDNFELAVYSKGDSKSPKLALVLPGKLDTKDYSHMKSHVDFLASKGFFSLSFDPPGTWESPGDIKLYTMTNYLKAINGLIKLYGNKPTFVMGHSRGATMAILAATTNPSVTAFAAVMTSFPRGGFKEEDTRNWKEKGYAISKRDLPPGGGAKVKEFRLSYDFYEDQFQHDMTEDLKQSTKPKLFIYGTRDKLAKPEVIRDLCKVSNEPKELYELDSDHDYRHNQKLIEEVNQVVGMFLDKFNL